MSRGGYPPLDAPRLGGLLGALKRVPAPAAHQQRQADQSGGTEADRDPDSCGAPVESAPGLDAARLRRRDVIRGRGSRERTVCQSRRAGTLAGVVRRRRTAVVAIARDREVVGGGGPAVSTAEGGDVVGRRGPVVGPR